ncbi:NERD domain-containing protein [Streptomyces sp. NPDC003860]
MSALLRVTPAGGRLCVLLPNGRAVAWYDPDGTGDQGGEGRTRGGEGGRIFLVHERLRDEVLAVLAPYVTGNVTVGPPPVPTSADLARLALHPDDDLAPNRPGEALHARLDPLPPPRRLTRDPHRGARARLAAQQSVGDALDGLESAGWRVVHSVPLPGADHLHHVAVGPGGVLALHALPARGLRILVEGEGVRAGRAHPAPLLDVARHRAERAALALATAVRPVLVIVGAARLEVLPPTPVDVRVVRDGEVPALASLGGVLKPVDVEALYAAARDRRTWLRA